MLHKIIYKNFKSNIRKYILFFVSNIIAVAELFIFWGLNDVVVRAVTEPSIMMGIKSDFMIFILAGVFTAIDAKSTVMELITGKSVAEVTSKR